MKIALAQLNYTIADIVGNKEKIIVAYYEITNWIFVKRTIRKHKYTSDWDNFKLRADWVGRIYTVLNPMEPSDDGDTEEVLRIKYAERMKPINLYLDSIGLSESMLSSVSIYPGIDKVICSGNTISLSGTGATS